jgi:hypothetical protein
MCPFLSLTVVSGDFFILGPKYVEGIEANETYRLVHVPYCWPVIHSLRGRICKILQIRFKLIN